jgi:hypothetical protein
MVIFKIFPVEYDEPHHGSYNGLPQVCDNNEELSILLIPSSNIEPFLYPFLKIIKI